MTRLRGWAPRGERLVDKVPQGKWNTATFLAALRNDRIDAPCLFDGPINGERFHAYVEQFLVPTLKPGDVVILDNLGSHKGKAVRQTIRSVGARLVFLPNYSPDLNPIEQVFAKFKTLLRKAGARTYEGAVTRTEFGRTKIGNPSSDSGRGNGSPRPESFRSEGAERATGCEMALDVESVVDGGVN
jgi:transposase